MKPAKKKNSFVVREKMEEPLGPGNYDIPTRHNPFFKDGKPNPAAYLEFVTQANEFVNHKPKPFRRMIDKVMKI